MKKWLSWFDPSDGLDTTATFLLCVPFLFLVTPPLLAAQLPAGFLPLTLLGWVSLPLASYHTAQAAHRRSRRGGRHGFASLLLWIAITYSMLPLLALVGVLFWQQNDYGWTAAMMGVGLVLLWESARKWQAYALRRVGPKTCCKACSPSASTECPASTETCECTSTPAD